MPAARYWLATGALNNALYAVGGDDGSNACSNVYRYNGTNWSEVAALPQQRKRLAAGVLDNYLYAIGGYNSSDQTNVYRYNGTNWTEVAGLPAARSCPAAAVLNDYLYVIGGGSGATSALLVSCSRTENRGRNRL